MESTRASITRRAWLAAALALAGGAAGGLSGCGGAAGSGTGRAPGTSGGGTPGNGDAIMHLVTSDVERAAPDPTARAEAVTAITDFGADALRAAAAGERGNLVLSPVSIHLALGMTVLGARGRTATEMLTTLHAEDAGRLAVGLNALSADLASRTGRVRVGDDEQEIDLATANALWGQQGITWSPAFLDALAAHFGAGMRVVDFTRDGDRVRRTINAWVGEQTHDTIPDLLAPGALGTDVRLTLVDALYLKAPWAVPFERETTKNGEFTRADGRTVGAPFMHQDASLPYHRGDGWQAVRLPYAENRLAMTVLLPDAGRFDTVLEGLDGGLLRRALATPTPAPVRLAMPRWRTRTSLALRPMLTDLGMPTAFTDAADFTGMTSDVGLAVDAVQHQGYIAVDEAGTEASAATSVEMRAVAAPASPVDVTLDRPFLYVLHDGPTSAPLFVGVVADPTA